MVEASPELEALQRNVQATFSRIIEQVPYLPEELQLAVANLEDPAELAHMIAGALRIKTEEKQAAARGARRGQAPAPAVASCSRASRSSISIGTRIQSQVQSEMEKGQREYFLRQQLKAIQEELGEVDEQPGRGHRAARAARGGGAARARLARPPSASSSASSGCPRRSAEHGVIRTYLEWIGDAAVEQARPRTSST